MKLLLIDGFNVVFRAFFAIRGLSNADGMSTGAVYGFVAMLEGLLRDEAPDAVAVAFDSEGPTFRTERYPDYKAHRPPMPEELAAQLPWLDEVVQALALPRVQAAGWEADDLIATLASQAAADGAEVVIASSDKDLLQLVGGGVVMLDTMKAIRYGPAEVRDKWAVDPGQFVDFQGLCGDSSDNVPGVPGIGPKGAAKLIGEFGSLEALYAALDGDHAAARFKGKQRENLLAHRDQAFLSRELARLERAVPGTADWRGLRLGRPDTAALRRLYGALGFRSLLARLPADEAAPAAQSEAALGREGDTLVCDAAGLAAMTAALRAAGAFAFDTETTGLDPLQDTLVGLSFAVGRTQSWYVPVGHLLGEGGAEAAGQTGLFDAPARRDPRQLALSEVLAAIGPLLTDPALGKRAQNAKFDVQMLAAAGVEVRGLDFDPMLADYLLDPAASGGHGLDALAARWLNHQTIHYRDLAGTSGGAAGFARVSVEDAVPYACEDAQVVEALRLRMAPALEQEGLLPLLRDLELPLALVLAKMELRGVCLDVAQLHALGQELRARARAVEVQAHAAAGRPFNLGSPKQLAGLLFGELGLPVKRASKSGPSTDSSVLEQLTELHPLPGLVLAWRSLTKLDGTYVSVLPGLVHPRTGRVHTRFHQAVAATGRLSSADPNLQNIPIRSEDGRRIRAAFVAAPGHLLVSADYSQIELRVLAHLCGDPDLQQAFRDGADVHARTAAQLFGVAERDVSRAQRATAKTVNFGILYGMSATRLAREQQLSRKEAQALIERYFARYPAIERWKAQALEEARSSGMTRTLLGRARRLPDLHAKGRQQVAAAERMAVNTPIQGSAADIIKVAMVELEARLARELPTTKLLLQVHDELLLEAPEAEAEAAAALCAEVMAGAFELDVPLVVNSGVGADWLAAH
jgi:DNA polymerase-1